MLNYGVIAIFPLFSLVIFGDSSKSAQFLLPLMIGLSIGITRNVGGAVGIPILTSIISISNGRLDGTFQYGVLFSILCVIGLVGLFIGGKFEGDAVKTRNN